MKITTAKNNKNNKDNIFKTHNNQKDCYIQKHIINQKNCHIQKRLIIINQKNCHIQKHIIIKKIVIFKTHNNQKMKSFLYKSGDSLEISNFYLFCRFHRIDYSSFYIVIEGGDLDFGLF